MRVLQVREAASRVSRFADRSARTDDPAVSVVAVVTDVVRDGAPVVGFGFSPLGRFAEGTLVRERFGPRLCSAREAELVDATGANLDPFRAWSVLTANERAGSHGERSVALGTLDMALWDATAKIAEVPLYRLLAERVGRGPVRFPSVSVYADGGHSDSRSPGSSLREEVIGFRDLGFRRIRIQIGGVPLARDLERIDEVAALLEGPKSVAVDASFAYDSTSGPQAAEALTSVGPWWFEDFCDPFDFDTVSRVAQRYKQPIAAGESLCSVSEALLLDRYGGLRRDRDVLDFDPVHCYGMSGFLGILDALEERGWPRSAFWPHGGHLFSLHVAAALGLGGTGVDSLSFQPFGGFGDDLRVSQGRVRPPELPGIGLESKPELVELLNGMFDLPRAGFAT